MPTQSTSEATASSVFETGVAEDATTRGARRGIVASSVVRRLAALVCLVAGVHLTASPLLDRPTLMMERAELAQGLVNEMRVVLGIDPAVQVAVVVYHPLVFSVEPVDSNRDQFILSVEFGFLIRLEDDELRAALAHELGHVWVFTHHPFLQTERLANEIARPMAERSSFERVYEKLWSYEGSTGVPIENLLGADEPGPEALSSPGRSSRRSP